MLRPPGKGLPHNPWLIAVILNQEPPIVSGRIEFHEDSNCRPPGRSRTRPLRRVVTSLSLAALLDLHEVITGPDECKRIIEVVR